MKITSNWLIVTKIVFLLAGIIIIAAKGGITLASGILIFGVGHRMSVYRYMTKKEVESKIDTSSFGAWLKREIN